MKSCPHCGRNDEWQQTALILAAYLMIMKQVYEIEIAGTTFEDIPFDDIIVEKTHEPKSDLYTINLMLHREDSNVLST